MLKSSEVGRGFGISFVAFEKELLKEFIFKKKKKRQVYTLTINSSYF